ncbi:hypothetical protein [Planomicrobium sp. YIM 101495]|uniref:hypothetical protein n=1 Tax=Planomicrobium sp. YIM 101495 TaxID=2665160 RepID=UPI0012B8E2DB|nr:hypothetical protein [Planomicrobium sp. YIM 101495]MTD30137.1 hypothetical protein [Planomicrobium sp. YIM 101495]
MKWILRLLVVLAIVGAAGCAIYYFAVDYAAEQVAAKATEEFVGERELTQAKTYIEQNPQLAGYVEEAKKAEAEGADLVVKTKGDAARLLIKKVGVTELAQMQSELESGNASIDEMISKLEGTLTEEELLALKVIAYKEIYQNE